MGFEVVNPSLLLHCTVCHSRGSKNIRGMQLDVEVE